MQNKKELLKSYIFVQDFVVDTIVVSEIIDIYLTFCSFSQ